MVQPWQDNTLGVVEMASTPQETTTTSSVSQPVSLFIPSNLANQPTSYIAKYMMYIYITNFVNQHISPTWIRPCNEGTSPNEAAYAATWGEVEWSCNGLVSMIIFGVHKKNIYMMIYNLYVCIYIYIILQYLVKNNQLGIEQANSLLPALTHDFWFPNYTLPRSLSLPPSRAGNSASISQLLMAAPYVMLFPSDVIP